MKTAQEICRRMSPGPRQLIGLYWLAGEIALREGDLTTARLLFQEILSRDSCDSRPFQAAMASLRLARIYLQLGDSGSLADLTARVTLMLQPLRKHPFARAALTEFYRLAGERRLTLKSLDRLFAEFERRGRATR